MKLYAITLGLTLAVQFVRAEDIGTEIDRLTAYGEGWWKECDAVTSLYERVRSDLLQEKDAEKRRELAERVFDWALALPTDWIDQGFYVYFAEEHYLLLQRMLDIPPLSTNTNIVLKYAGFIGKFYNRVVTLEKEIQMMKEKRKSMRTIKEQKTCYAEIAQTQRTRMSYRTCARIGSSSWLSLALSKLGESLTEEECASFAEQFMERSRLEDDNPLLDIKKDLLKGVLNARLRRVEEKTEKERKRIEDERSKREKADAEALMRLDTEWVEVFQPLDWYQTPPELLKHLHGIKPMFERFANEDFAFRLAKRIYTCVCSFPMDWTHPHAPIFSYAKLYAIREATLPPILGDTELALDFAARLADLREKLNVFEIKTPEHNKGSVKTRKLLLEWEIPLALKERAVQFSRRKIPTERAAFLEKYAAAARLSPEEKRKLLAEVLAEMPKPTEPEKPVAN